MATDLRTVRRLLGAVVGAGLAGALSMSSAGAALLEDHTSENLSANPDGVEECVEVTVPTATATVKATLTVNAGGVSSTTERSTTVNTPDLGTVEVCVEADAGATVALTSDVVADADTDGATLNVDARVEGQADVDAKVTVNGEEVA